MSDISIPGVSSQYNTQKLIDDLMEVERIPLQRMEDQAETYRDQKRVWQDLNLKISKFRDSARALYGFDNPFLEKISTVSDPSVMEVTVGREAKEESSSVVVHSVAGADRFLSESLQEGYKVPGGTYRFSVGDESVEFSFRGGNLRDFSEAINKNSRNLLTSSVVKDTKKSEVILIGSQKTGAENTLTFEGDALPLAEKIGMIRRGSDSAGNVTLEKNQIRGIDTPLEENRVSVTDMGILVGPGGNASIPLSRRIPDTAKLTMEIIVQIKELPYDYTPPEKPSGPQIPLEKGAEISDIEIDNNPSWVSLPPVEEPVPPKRVDDLRVLYLADGKTPIPLPSLKSGSGEQTITVSLSDYIASVDSIQARNNNTHREIEIRSIKIFDPNARGDYEPVNPVTTASDAHLSIEGIDIYRSENDIDDVIPGITFHLKSPSGGPVSFSVEPDAETIKESIINFVGYYNQLLTEVLILTGQTPPDNSASRFSNRDDATIIDEIEYFEEEEREAARERLGLFQGDITLMQMKSRLQQVMMNAYDTGPDSNLRLLAQIGISTNAAGASNTSDRLRGYLQINEKELDKAISENVRGIKNLFGYDSDGDLVVDSGVAYTTEEYTRSYNQSGGILTMKQQTLDTKISRTSRDIDNYNQRLEQKESELRREYGRMESALESLQKSGEAIENFNRNNSGN